MNISWKSIVDGKDLVIIVNIIGYVKDNIELNETKLY